LHLIVIHFQSLVSNKFYFKITSPFTSVNSVVSVLTLILKQLVPSLLLLSTPNLTAVTLCTSVFLTLSPERQSAQMSKITNGGLTWSGTGCFIGLTATIWQLATVGVKGLRRNMNITLTCRLRTDLARCRSSTPYRRIQLKYSQACYTSAAGSMETFRTYRRTCELKPTSTAARQRERCKFSV